MSPPTTHQPESVSLSTPRSLDSLADIFLFLDDYCARYALSQGASFELDLIVEELFTNMVRHNVGGGDTILIELATGDHHVTIALTDFDVEPFDPTRTVRVDIAAPLQKRSEGGLGLHLVRRYADSLDYEYTDRNMKITAVKRLEAEDVRHSQR